MNSLVFHKICLLQHYLASRKLGPLVVIFAAATILEVVKRFDVTNVRRFGFPSRFAEYCVKLAFDQQLC